MTRLAGITAATMAAASLATGAEAATAPALRLVTEKPLVVRGVAFRPSERVALTAFTLLGPTRITVRASSTGTFRVPFRLMAQPCGQALAVRAVGARGSRATLQLRGSPCIPPPID